MNDFTDTLMIAPCGLNCYLCYAHLREKNKCPGCKKEAVKMAHCEKYVIRNCETIKQNEVGLCYACADFPCLKLRKLNKRYETKYHVSPVANLKYIAENGKEKFLKNEAIKWKCDKCGETMCMHDGYCKKCKNDME